MEMGDREGGADPAGRASRARVLSAVAEETTRCVWPDRTAQAQRPVARTAWSRQRGSEPWAPGSQRSPLCLRRACPPRSRPRPSLPRVRGCPPPSLRGTATCGARGDPTVASLQRAKEEFPGV